MPAEGKWKSAQQRETERNQMGRRDCNVNQTFSPTMNFPLGTMKSKVTYSMLSYECRLKKGGKREKDYSMSILRHNILFKAALINPIEWTMHSSNKHFNICYLIVLVWLQTQLYCLFHAHIILNCSRCLFSVKKKILINLPYSTFSADRQS